MNKKCNEQLTSIVITCHNYGRFLKESIDSVLKQTIKPKEILVINDASDDNTDEVATSFGNNIIYHKVNFKNAQKTRNFGLRQSTGEYILFLDADDYLRNDCIEKMQVILEINEDIHLVYSDRYHFGDLDLMKKKNIQKKWSSQDFNYELLRRNNYISLPSLIRKNKFKGFDESIKRFQDWDAWLTFLKREKAKRIDDYLFFVRIHGKSLTFNNDLHAQRVKILIKHNFEDIIIYDYKTFEEQLNYCNDNIQQKTQELEQKNQIIQQKDQIINQKIQELEQKDQIINQKQSQIQQMQSSKSFRLGNLFFRSLENPYKMLTFPINFVRILFEL